MRRDSRQTCTCIENENLLIYFVLLFYIVTQKARADQRICGLVANTRVLPAARAGVAMVTRRTEAQYSEVFTATPAAAIAVYSAYYEE